MTKREKCSLRREERGHASKGVRNGKCGKGRGAVCLKTGENWSQQAPVVLFNGNYGLKRFSTVKAISI